MPGGLAASRRYAWRPARRTLAPGFWTVAFEGGTIVLGGLGCSFAGLSTEPQVMNQNTSPPGRCAMPPPLPPGNLSEPSAADKAKVAAQKASQEAKKLFARVWPYCQPVVDKAWLNLRVWVPFLATPNFATIRWCMEAQSRDATSWTVSLPKQCWNCNTTAGVISRDYERDLRTFEGPSASWPVRWAWRRFSSFCLSVSDGEPAFWRRCSPSLADSCFCTSRAGPSMRNWWSGPVVRTPTTCTVRHWSCMTIRCT